MRLRRAAARTLGDPPAPPDPRTFADEAEHTRAVDAPFIGWCAGVPFPNASTAASCRVPAGQDDGAPLDVRLWRALHEPLESAVSLLGKVVLASGRHASLVSIISPEVHGLEVATEMQLCALHALTWLARRALGAPDRGAVHAAVRATIADLCDTVQPDNATNHPWAIHAFVLEAAGPAPVRPADDLLLYAQTLLHNSQVQRGRPDRLSAWILWDAARPLDAHTTESAAQR